MKSKFFDWLALVLVLIGGLNWGLIGFFHFDFVSMLFGDMTYLTRLVYCLVGISTLYLIYVVAKFKRIG